MPENNETPAAPVANETKELQKKLKEVEKALSTLTKELATTNETNRRLTDENKGLSESLKKLSDSKSEQALEGTVVWQGKTYEVIYSCKANMTLDEVKKCHIQEDHTALIIPKVW